MPRARSRSPSTTRRYRSSQSQVHTPTASKVAANDTASAPKPTQNSVWYAVVPIALIIMTCGVNNWVLELIVSKKRNPFGDPGAGTLLTLLQACFAAFLTLPVVVTQLKQTVPVKYYALQAALYAPMSFLNNKAFDFNITQPVHMVFRSSTLVVACLIGALFFGRRYGRRELLCVTVVTVGVFLATAAEALFGNVSGTSCCDGDTPEAVDSAVNSDDTGATTADGGSFVEVYGTWLIGVSCLVAVMVLGAVLGQVQNATRQRFGSAPLESLFYSHLLSLPPYLAALSDLHSRSALWTATPAAKLALPYLLSGGPATKEAFAEFDGEWTWMGVVGDTPVMWLYVAANLVSQFVCVMSVYTLISRFSSLTVTMALTVRKVVSLLVSLWFFGNPFTPWHWTGATLVFAGATLYSCQPKPKSE